MMAAQNPERRGARTEQTGRRVAAGALALALAALAVGAAASAGAPDARITASTAAGAEQAFALALLPRLGATGNVVYSPYSIDTALTMAAAGAKGATAAQIDRALGASSTANATANGAAVAREVLATASSGGSGGPLLELANALWTQTGVPLQSAFVQTLSATFGAPPLATDFRGAPDGARQAINAWVSKHTAQLIRKLLPPGSVSPATVFVLANAIYLKAHWATPFDARETHDAPFTTSTGARVSVPFMSANATAFAYASAPGVQAVELPYRSSSLSLLAILPGGQSLTRFESTLNAASLASLVGSLRNRSVNLRLPKIHLQTQTALNDPLRQLGITDAFGASADFSGITADVPLRISLVEHAADLKLDEQGTVAAAATGIIGPTAIALPPGPTVTMDLNHPYLLLLRDDTSGTILFVAQVNNASAS